MGRPETEGVGVGDGDVAGVGDGDEVVAGVGVGDGDIVGVGATGVGVERTGRCTALGSATGVWTGGLPRLGGCATGTGDPSSSTSASFNLSIETVSCLLPI